MATCIIERLVWEKVDDTHLRAKFGHQFYRLALIGGEWIGSVGGWHIFKDKDPYKVAAKCQDYHNELIISQIKK